MARCGISSMNIHFLVDPHVAQVTQHLRKAWLPTMLKGVGHTTPPHPYKPRGLYPKPLPSQPLLAPLNHLSHFSTLTRSRALTRRILVSSSYNGFPTPYVGHQPSYTVFWDFLLNWWPMVKCGLPSRNSNSPMFSLSSHR